MVSSCAILLLFSQITIRLILYKATSGGWVPNSKEEKIQNSSKSEISTPTLSNTPPFVDSFIWLSAGEATVKCEKNLRGALIIFP